MDDHEHGRIGIAGLVIHCRYPGNSMTHYGRHLGVSSFHHVDRPATCRRCLVVHTRLERATETRRKEGRV